MGRTSSKSSRQRCATRSASARRSHSCCSMSLGMCAPAVTFLRVSCMPPCRGSAGGLCVQKAGLIRIEVMHGVTLGSLGKSEPEHYGTLLVFELERQIEQF